MRHAPHVLLLMLGLIPHGAAAQEPLSPPGASEEATTPEVSLGGGSGRLGDRVALPIRLKGAAALEAPFQIVLRYAPSELRYERLVSSRQARRAQWKLETARQTAPAAFDMEFLEVTVEPIPGESLAGGGELAAVHFEILHGRPGEAITVHVTLRSEDDRFRPAAPGVAEILIWTDPAFACFFYMH